MEEADRLALIQLYWEKALKFLSQAEKEYNEQCWDLAANRYYYATFHALHALFVRNELHAKSHEGLIRMFGREFILSGKMDAKFGPMLARLEQLRTKADYNCAYSVSKEDVDAYRENVKAFIALIGTMIG